LFGQRVAALRKRAGLTQAALAEALGVSPPLVAYYERQTANPTVDVVNKLATFFDVPPSHFLDGDGKTGESKRGPLSDLDQRVERLRQLPKSKHKLLLRMLDAFIDDVEASP
jgi:transcriptional regulator with XRE-family HTH domain